MKRAHGEPAHNLGTSEYAFAQVLIFKAASIPSSSRFLLIIRFGDREQLRRIRAHHLELGVALKEVLTAFDEIALPPGAEPVYAGSQAAGIIGLPMSFVRAESAS